MGPRGISSAVRVDSELAVVTPCATGDTPNNVAVAAGPVDCAAALVEGGALAVNVEATEPEGVPEI
jgi:hypothetical protein